MDYAIMFDVMKDGEITPVKWDKNNLNDDRSIILLDESTMSIFLWHGKQRGLVDRRIALRQADALKGHGYTSGKTIIGIDIRAIKEIDQRKLGRDKETDEMKEELDVLFSQKHTEMENFLVSFGEGVAKPEKKVRPMAEPSAQKEDVKVAEKETPKPAAKAKAKPSVIEQKEETRQKPAITSKAKEVTKPTITAEKIEAPVSKDLIIKLDSIEDKLDNLISEFKAFKDNIQTPEFVKNLQVLKNIIKNEQDASSAPTYPSREQIEKDDIKHKTDEL